MRHAAKLPVVLALAGLGSALEAQPIPISGRVVDSSGAAAAGVEVELLEALSPYAQARLELAGDDREPVAATRTEDDGTFAIAAPEVGFWQVVVTAADSLPMVARFVGEPLLEAASLPPLRLEEAEPLSVRVTDTKGSPLAGAVLRVTDTGRGPRRSRWDEYLPPTRTDASGHGTVPWPVGAKLRVRAMMPGYLPSPHSLHRTSAGARPLELALEPAGPRVLQLLDSVGNPVPDAVVEIDDGPATLTAEDGRAKLDLPSDGGAFRLVTPDGQRFALRLAGTEGVREPFAFVIPEPRVTTGLVLDALDRRPISNALVFPRRGPDRVARTDSRGGFQLSTGQSDRQLIAVAAGYLVGYESLGRDGGSRTLLLERAVNLSGRVLDSAGEPVTGATVLAESDLDDMMRSSRRLTERSSTTDGSGSFVLARVDASARYVIAAAKTGYAPSEIVIRDSSEAAAAGDLTLTLERGSGAYGRIVDPDGIGVAGASVVFERDVAAGSARHLRQLVGDRDRNFAFGTTADAAGDFSISGLPAARYIVEATAAGFARETVLGLEVEATIASELGVITLERGVPLVGRVVDSAGAPIEGALVRIGDEARLPSAQARPQLAPLISAEDGSFTLADRREGERVTLYVERQGYAPRYLDGVRIEVGEIVEVALTPAVTLSGRVLAPDGQPVAGARVRAFGQEGNSKRGGSGAALSDDLGRFVLEDLEPGEVRLTAAAANWLKAELGPIELAPGSDLDDFEITLRAGGRVEGRVIGADGRAIEDAWVSGEGSGSAKTDGQGSYALGAVELGRRMLTASTSKTGLTASEEITVEPGLNHLDFYLTGGFEVSGRVLTTRGDAVDDALVEVNPTAVSWTGFPAHTRSARDGTFRVQDVAPGVYSIQVSHPEYSAVSPSEPLEVADQPVLGLEVRMTSGSSIVGRLTGLDALQLAGASATAIRRGEYREGILDSDGGYRIDHLAPGEWVVMAASSEGQRVQATVEVAEGSGETALDLDFADGIVLTGRVLLGGEPQDGLRIWATHGELAGSASASTDYQGRFELRGLERGIYVLRVASHTGGFMHTETVEVRRQDDITIEIEAASISGVVLAADSALPLARASLRIEIVSQAEAFALRRGQSAQSDDRGRFKLDSLGAGTYRLSASREGYATRSQVLEIESGVALSGLEFELEPASGLAFRVTSHLGTPIRSVYWAVLDASGAAVANGMEQATSDGLVRLTSVSEGNWTVLLAAPGSALYRRQIQVPTTVRTVRLERAASFSLRVPELSSVSFGGTLRVRAVTGERFRNLTWGGGPQDHWPLFLGRTQLDNLPAGRWIVTVKTEDERRWEETVSLAPGANDEVVLD